MLPLPGCRQRRRGPAQVRLGFLQQASATGPRTCARSHFATDPLPDATVAADGVHANLQRCCPAQAYLYGLVRQAQQTLSRTKDGAVSVSGARGGRARASAAEPPTAGRRTRAASSGSRARSAIPTRAAKTTDAWSDTTQRPLRPAHTSHTASRGGPPSSISVSRAWRRCMLAQACCAAIFQGKALWG
jgi:hypothetical protein